MHEATTTPDPPRAAASLDRRNALKAAALAIAAVPVAGCESGDGHPGTAGAGQDHAGTGAGRHDPAVATHAPGQAGAREHGPAAVPDRPPASAGRAGTATATGAGTATATPRTAGSGVASPAPGTTGGPATRGRTALPPELTNGPRNRPNVALTFHGQGDPAQVRALLGELERGGARVTVLAVGSWLETAPDLAKRILDGGHELGNHTQNHLDLVSLSAADAFNEINACAGVLRRLVGSIGTWFRPSQTQHSTPTIRAQAARVGYPTCLSYDVDSLDNTDPGAAAVTRTVAGTVANGSVISMHCGHAGTVAAIPAILDLLHGRGLRPVTMSELVAAR